VSDYHQFGEPSGAGFIDTHFDFKQCQRSNGSIYGVPDTSDCAMKGAKEVKKKVAEVDTKEKKGMEQRYLNWFNDQGEGRSIAKQKAYLTATVNALKDAGTVTEEMRVKLANEIVDAKGEPSIELKQRVGQLVRDHTSSRKHRDKSGESKPKAALDPNDPRAWSKGGKTESKPEESKRTIKVTRPNATQSEMLAEWRNTYKYQRDRGEPKANARRNATFDLLNEGYDIRKLHRTPSNPNGVFTDMGVDMNNLVFK